MGLSDGDDQHKIAKAHGPLKVRARRVNHEYLTASQVDARGGFLKAIEDMGARGFVYCGGDYGLQIFAQVEMELESF